jgi:hypothetical protein
MAAPRVDQVWLATFDRLKAPLQRRDQVARLADGPLGRDAVITRETCDVDRRIVDPLADPPVLDRPVTCLRHELLLDLVREIRPVVGDDDQDRDLVVRGRPHRRGRAEELAVPHDADADPVAAVILQGERRPDRHPGAGPHAPAAVISQVVHRFVERVGASGPVERQPGETQLAAAAKIVEGTAEIAQRRHLVDQVRLGCRGRRRRR